MKRLMDLFAALFHAPALDKSGVFQSKAYSDRYIAGGLWKKWPLLHYLLVGEGRGYRPNAFFAPDDFFRSTGSRSLVRYLFSGRTREATISGDFDARFYAAAAMSTTTGHPFLDFWAVGFERDISPAATLDLPFVKYAVGRDVPDKRDLLFRILTGAHDACRTASELKRRQEGFRRKIELHVLVEPTAARRRNLVFIQAASDFVPDARPDTRSYDMMLNRYDAAGAVTKGADCITYQFGSKVTGIAKLLAERRDLLDYDHVLFLDDDVSIDHSAIETLLATVERDGLDLAQPSLSARSSTYWKALKQPTAGPGLTQLNAVEIMAPVLSRRALDACGWTFGESVSGWGVDYLLGAEVTRRLGTTPTLVGACVAEHLRPLDTDDGPFYRLLQRDGIDARTEAGAIARAFAVPDSIRAL